MLTEGVSGPAAPGWLEQGTPLWRLPALGAWHLAQQAGCGPGTESSSLDVCSPLGSSLKAGGPVLVLFSGTSVQGRGLAIRQLHEPMERGDSDLVWVQIPASHFPAQWPWARRFNLSCLHF